MAKDEAQAGASKFKQKRVPGPDRRKIDRRRGGRRANNLFRSNWAFSILIAVFIFLGVVITLQSHQMKMSYGAVKALHDRILEQNSTNK